MSIPTLTQNILGLKSLIPGKETNQAFTSLVRYIVDYSNLPETEANNLISRDLSADLHTRLIELCGRGEAELEKYWAIRIIEEESSLMDFPYYLNYIELTKREASLIEHFDKNWQAKEMVFIGGGSIPFTSIILAQYYGVKSTVIDLDPDAVAIATKLIEILGLSNFISIEMGSGERYSNYSGDKIVFIAALAGLEDLAKSEIFSNVINQVTSKQLVVTRSSWGLRQLLYKPVPVDLLLRMGFELLYEYHPTDEVINSVLIFKKSEL